MDAHKYYSTEINPSISKLPESDRLLLIEALFTGMIKSLTAYYDLIYANRGPEYVKRDAEDIKNMIDARVKLVSPVYSGTVVLEANPMEPMDKFFVTDATMDFNSLMKSVSKSK